MLLDIGRFVFNLYLILTSFYFHLPLQIDWNRPKLSHVTKEVVNCAINKLLIHTAATLLISAIAVEPINSPFLEHMKHNILFSVATQLIPLFYIISFLLKFCSTHFLHLHDIFSPRGKNVCSTFYTFYFHSL